MKVLCNAAPIICSAGATHHHLLDMLCDNQTKILGAKVNCGLLSWLSQLACNAETYLLPHRVLLPPPRRRSQSLRRTAKPLLLLLSYRGTCKSHKHAGWPA